MAGRGGWGRKKELEGATWTIDPNHKPDDRPTELFPTLSDLPPPRALSRDEKRIVQNFKALRTAVHQGPLYTESKRSNPLESKKLYDDEQRNAAYGKGSRTAKPNFDPFEDGVPTYSLKYVRIKRTIPQLTGRPFNKDLFPPELHDTLEGKTSKNGPKTLRLALTAAQQAAADAARKQRLDLLEAEEGDAGDDQAPKDDEEAAVDEEDVDNNYEEDELDMGGDYDAEQYFDGGEGDDDDMDGGGGDEY